MHDDVEYIVRTLKTVEYTFESKCLGIIVYPIMKKQAIGTLYKKIHVSEEEYSGFVDRLKKEVSTPILSFEYALNSDVLMELIFNCFAE